MEASSGGRWGAQKADQSHGAAGSGAGERASSRHFTNSSGVRQKCGALGLQNKENKVCRQGSGVTKSTFRGKRLEPFGNGERSS